jgi:hypothetical protein
LRLYDFISLISVEWGIAWPAHLFACHCFHIRHQPLEVYRPGRSTVPWVEEPVMVTSGSRGSHRPG